VRALDFRALAKLLILLVGAGAVVACGSGSGGGSNLSFGGEDADPVAVDYPIAYVKRPLLVDDNGDLLAADLTDAAAFRPGAELLFRDRASASAQERSLTAGVFPDDAMGNPPSYDVKDLSTSFDGMQLVFAMRAPEDPNLGDDEQPTWNLWIYDRATDALRRVIASDIVAEDGQDVAPRFLPDGRIIFSSTRQRRAKAVLLDEGKPQFSALDEDRDQEAFALHVVNADGTDLEQVTYNQSSDLDPAVLGDGTVVFSRWDNFPGGDSVNLYRMNPDGTEHQVLYGVHSHDTGPNGENVDFAEPRELPDGRLLVSMRSADPQTHMGAALVAIDVANYSDHDQPTFANQGLVGDAQELLVPGSITLDASPSPRGRFASVEPLFDGTDRLLVTWSQCRLIDPASDPANPTIVPCTAALLAMPNIEEAPPLYGVWMFDVAQVTQQPIVAGQEGFAYTEAVVMADRASPPVVFDKVPGLDLDPDLVGENVGVLHIRNVYEFDGVSAVDIETLRDPAATTADERPARFLRIEKAVSIPDPDIADFDDTAFGISRANLMREIVGYVPIEPDGSVKLKVPADIAFFISVLDANGRRITARHRNWMQLRAGEERECNGCHAAASEMPHGRPDAEAPSTNAGAPVDGSPFPNTEPALFADAGETMAETFARINGVRTPDVDVEFTDEWTDPAVRAKDASFFYRFTDLRTPVPTAPACVGTWTAICRITIHYPVHIQPLWEAPRQSFDGMGNLIADDRCTLCHSTVDAMGAAQVPAAQLDLSGTPSAAEPDHAVSYQALMVDADGSGPIMSPAGANASDRFFSRFAFGASHAGWLSGAELKLVSEWLDIGAQYYNDPFAAPQN